MYNRLYVSKYRSQNFFRLFKSQKQKKSKINCKRAKLLAEDNFKMLAVINYMGHWPLSLQFSRSSVHGFFSCFLETIDIE